MTLRSRLTAAFVLVVLVPLLLVVALLSALLPSAMAGSQEQGLSASGRLAAAVVAELCGRARGAAEAAGRASTTVAPAELAVALEQLVRSGLADGVRAVTPEGTSLAAAGTAPDVPARDCTTGDAVRTDEAVQVVATVTLQRPGTGSAGSAVAAFTVGDALARRLQAVAGSGDVALLADGEVVASSGAVPGGLVRAALAAPDRPVRVGRSLAVLTGTRPGQPVAVLLTQPESERVAVLPLALGVTLGAVLLAGGIAFLLARATTRPLEELGAAAARVAGGDLSSSIEVRSYDEIGRLAGTFNAMIDALRRSMGALESSRDELQAGVARLGEALSGTHDLDRILPVVLETAQASTRARAGAILLLTADRSELALAVGRGLAENGVDEHLRLPFGVGIVGRVARTGDAVRGRVGTATGQLRAGPGEPATTTLVAVPLKSSTTVIGVLVLFEREGGGEFSEDDLAMLRTFTSQATVAVDNLLMHEEARRLSITDGLTGLWNYRYFQLTVGKEIERASRFGRPMALLMLDLDYFKLINDLHGHPRGDAVLVELADRVRRTVRDVDMIARYGGEEFVAILPETDECGALQTAERIVTAVRRRPFGADDDDPLQVTISMGVALFPAHGTTAAILLRRADEALYAAKRAGRDTWRLALDPPAAPGAGGPSVDKPAS